MRLGSRWASSALWLKKWYREVNKCMHLWSSKERWHRICISAWKMQEDMSYAFRQDLLDLQSILRLWNLMHIWSDYLKTLQWRKVTGWCTVKHKHLFNFGIRAQFSLPPTEDASMMTTSDQSVCYVTIQYQCYFVLELQASRYQKICSPLCVLVCVFVCVLQHRHDLRSQNRRWKSNYYDITNRWINKCIYCLTLAAILQRCAWFLQVDITAHHRFTHWTTKLHNE